MEVGRDREIVCESVSECVSVWEGKKEIQT